jgi:hypothetical protein
MLTASIVTYHNDPALLSRCIGSVLAGDSVSKLYVVDNSAANDLAGLCRDDRIEYLHTGINIGYGRAHNRAIRLALDRGADYHLVLNPDVYFEPQALIGLRDFMDRRPDVGLVMPKIMYPDGKLQRLCKLLPTPWHLFARRFLPMFTKKADYNYQLEFADYNTCFECPSLSGCFMFLRTAVLEQVGLFDERFFMYFEDVDLVRRIGLCFKTVYWPDVAITHHYEMGSYSSKKLLLYHLMSAVRYFNKWGWFFDVQRRTLNSQTIARLKDHCPVK